LKKEEGRRKKALRHFDGVYSEPFAQGALQEEGRRKKKNIIPRNGFSNSSSNNVPPTWLAVGRHLRRSTKVTAIS